MRPVHPELDTRIDMAAIVRISQDYAGLAMMHSTKECAQEGNPDDSKLTCHHESSLILDTYFLCRKLAIDVLNNIAVLWSNLVCLASEVLLYNNICRNEQQIYVSYM